MEQQRRGLGGSTRHGVTWATSNLAVDGYGKTGREYLRKTTSQAEVWGLGVGTEAMQQLGKWVGEAPEREWVI